MQKTREIITIVALALAAAVFYVSAVFLSNLILIKSTIISLVYIAVIGGIYLLAMIGKNRKEVVIKWLITLPAVVGIWWLFRRCKFAIRGLNWLIPGYGRQSAGGSFAWTYEFFALSIMCLGAIIISLSFRPKQYEGFRKTQLVACMLLMAASIAVVFYLERQFPSIETISAYIYS